MDSVRGFFFRIVSLSFILTLLFVSSTSAQLPLDSAGWTIIQPSETSRIIYVSASEGSDQNNGLSEQAPVKSISRAKQLVRDTYPDHILLKRGDTWTISEGLGSFYSGKSAEEPMVVSYYGNEGGRPLIKTERPFFYLENGERSHLGFIGLEFYAYKHDPSSPNYESEKGVSAISFINASGENILIEDCKFNYMQMGAYTTGSGKEGRATVGALKNFKFRRNICLHSWAGDSYHVHETRTRVQGMFIYGVEGILLEENLFDHNGWNEQIEGAGATMYNHNIYMSTSNPHSEKILIRGNIIARASANGLHLRSGGYVENNLFVQNANNVNLGYHGSAPLPKAFAVVRGNVFQEVRLMDSTNTAYPRTASVRGIGDITIPSVVEDNILSNCINVAQFAIDMYNNKWGFGGEMVQRNNIAYKWVKKNDKPNPAWPNPNRTISDYHKSIGKEASTTAFLLEARERPLKTWWPEYSADNVNQFIREGFYGQ